MTSIYLDHAATTPIREEVLTAMMPFLSEHFGNASSVHARGRRARHAVESSRERVARVLGVEPADVVFTSGGTEANNMLIGSARTGLVTCLAEHDAVRAPADRLEAAGVEVHRVGAVSGGHPDWHAVSQAVQPGMLLSIMAVNNETGARNAFPDLPEGVVRHTDAVQAAAWYPLADLASRVDAMTLSGHKVGGPKGAGVLMVRSHVPLDALIRGGGQEQDRRSGTENVAAIVGMATALELAQREAAETSKRVQALRDAFRNGLVSALGPHVRCITPNREAAPHILQVIFHRDGAGLDGEMLILGLDVEGVEVSAGSACSSGALQRSHVLEAMGIPDAEARGVVRFSFGSPTTDAETEEALKRTVRVVRRML